MDTEIIPAREPTPRDLRRAATAILFAACVTAAIGYRFLLGADHDSKNLIAAWLYFLIGAVDLFVGATVMAYAGRGGSPGAKRRVRPAPPSP